MPHRPWLSFLGSVLLAGFLVACANGISGVTGSEARALVERGATLLDVRTPDEFGDDHLPGARNVPVDELRARLDAVGRKDQPVVVYCLSGSRSARAAGILHEAGFSQVYDMGPMSHWSKGR